MAEDLEKYLRHVADSPLTDDQKMELLRTVFYIMKSVIAIRFGVDPTQQAMGQPCYFPSDVIENALDSKNISNN